MKKLHQSAAGFTLVELLVVVVVTTIVMIVVTNFVLGNLQQTTLASLRASVLQQTEIGLDLVANDIRLSANADLNNRWPDANSPGGSSNQYGWTSNSSTLILATAAQDKSGNIIFSDPNNYITEKNNLIYFVSNGTLYKRILAAPDSNNAAVTTCPSADATSSCPADTEVLDNVTAFTVTYLDGQNDSVAPTNARSIQLAVTVSKKMYAQTVTASYTTDMVFRND